jgi:Flp pilus assembly protein CpaB
MFRSLNTLIIMFALVAALGLVTVVAADIMLTTQEAEAKCRILGTGYNASKGKCNP